MKPIVAIVGKPNSGKSTLFNRLLGKRKALVSRFSGFTRDRNYADVSFGEREFSLVDTGGLEPKTKDDILKDVKRQTELAIFASDIVLFLVDGKDGLNPIDKDIANILRKVKKKVILLVNKIDNEKRLMQVHEFYSLGMGTPIGISAVHGLNIGTVFEEIMEHLPSVEEAEDEEDLIKIALIGAPNVGKSSLVNVLLNEERLIVDKKPGTTRDSIDTFFQRGNDKFILIDTAGIRHKGTLHKSHELLSFLSAQRSIERADLALILLDASREFTEQDERIAGLAYQAGCACIILINKWDLIAQKFPHTDKVYRHEIKRKFKFLHFAPVLFTSAKTKHGIGKIIPWVTKVIKNYSREIPNNDLNRVISDALSKYHNPLYKGKRVKIGAIEQVRTKPPVFKLTASDWRGLHFSYRRYLENKIRDSFDFMGTPVKIVVRSKKSLGK